MAKEHSYIKMKNLQDKKLILYVNTFITDFSNANALHEIKNNV